MSATAPAAPIPGQFPPEDAQDFIYFDGIKPMHADRLAIFRQILIRTRGKPNELTDRVFKVDPATASIEDLTDSWEAAEQLDALVRELFQMQPFNPATGQGARVEHCWAVWDAFCEAMSEAKKKTDTSRIISPPMDLPTASPQPASNTSA